MAGTASPSPKARNTTILFVTIVSLLLILSYYIFVYVPSHEDSMHEQHFRVLNKIAQNINAKLGSTIGNARNIALDTKSARGKGEFELSELQANASLFNPNIQFEEPANETSAEEEADNGEPNFQIQVLEKKYGNPGIYVTDHATLNGQPRHYHFSISAENLVSNLLRFDHFEKFALFTPDRVLYETHPTGSRVKVPFDTLLNADKQISTSYFREMQYGGLPHVAYFRPLSISKEHQWMLIGFISTEKLNAQKYSLSPLFSIILLLLIILTFLSIPFIKIKIMHVREHLTVKEVALSFISATFIISILVLLVLLGYTYMGIDRPRIEDELRTLSDDISSELVAEIDNVLSVFKHQETLYDSSYQNLFEVKDQLTPPGLHGLRSIENTFFIDENGLQGNNKKSISSQPTPVINISSRNYFSKAKDSELLCTEGFRASDDTCFYLESIISFNTGKQLAAFSVAADTTEDNSAGNMAVLAGTGQFHSIINAVLPLGYGFAILDQEGTVLFHSDSNRNLQENFFEELEISNELQANMFGRTPGFIQTKYHDQSTMLRVAPIKNWPISIVTFYDSSLLSLKYLEVYTLFVTTFLIVFLGIALIFTLGFLLEKWSAVFWKNARQKPILSLNNIAPQKKRKENYAAVMVCYAVMLPVFALWAYLEHPGIAILVCTFLLCLQYWTLRYFFSNHATHGYWAARVFELVAISGAIGTILVLEFNPGPVSISFLYLVVPVIMLAFFIYGWRYHTVKNDDSIRPAWNWLKKIPFLRNTEYLKSYFRAIFLGSLTFSLLLTYSIYRASYLQESEAIQKFKIVQFARDVAAHETQELIYFDSLHRGDNTTDPRLRDLADLRIKECKGIYGGHIGFQETHEEASLSPFLFYPNFYQVKTRSKISTAHIFNEFNTTQNSMWSYTPGQLVLKKSETGCQAALNKPTLTIQRASFTSEIGRFRLMVMLIILLLVAGGYSMIKQIVMQLFILRTPEKYQFQSKEFRENMKSFKELMNIGKHLFMVTVPVQFRELVKHLNEEEYRQIKWAKICNGETNNLIKQGDDENRPLIILDFDLVGIEGEINGMNTIEEAMQTTDVVLVSNFDPLDLLHRILQRDSEKATLDAKQEHDMLADLLAEFETYYFPLTEDTIKQYQSAAQNQDLLVKEQNIYYEIWNSLTPDEQYVLYDLTHDGLVNTRNLPIIHRLYKKGLIIDEGNNFNIQEEDFISSLDIFNERFSRFIEKLAETENIKQLEEEINATGTWHKYRTPLLITLTGILLFVFITQQETYGEVIGVLGSIAASLPLILRLMNSFFSNRAANKADPA